VNRLARSSATHVLSVRHQNESGVLAHVFQILHGAGLRIEEVESIPYHGAQSAVARIHLTSPPDETVLEQIRLGNRHIISADLTALGGGA
jgi:D-3-phosphoglycerate dehydrogenase